MGTFLEESLRFAWSDDGLATFCDMPASTTGKGKGKQIDLEHSLFIPMTYFRGPSMPKHMQVGYRLNHLFFKEQGECAWK